MKRVTFFFLIASALGYLVAPQMADALPPCCCAASCGWSCQPFPLEGTDWECRQMYNKAVQNNTGQGIESSSSCGAMFIGEQCYMCAFQYCGGSAYTVAACDSSS